MQLEAALKQLGAERFLTGVIECQQHFGIDTPIRMAHFLAQCGHESAGFTRLVENMNYSATGLLQTWPKRFTMDGNDKTRAYAMDYHRRPEQIANLVYANRIGNGNVASGDGWKYRGRGLIQITGRTNYRRFGSDSHPELLEQPTEAAVSAGRFWQANGLNDFADSDDLESVTKIVNGAHHGIADRRERLKRAKEVLQ